MIVRLFIFFTTLSATFKTSLWKWWYQKLAAFYPHDDFRFMNYGYAAPTQNEPSLDDHDEQNRLFIQLYAHTLSGIDSTGKELLEVGSGRGGGADFVARYLNPASVIGVDFSKNAVAIANRFHQIPNLKFVEGNAENLPFNSDRFDVVYNVESSHCYGNMPQFIAEVKRVLKPGGIFAWSDFRTKEQMDREDSLFMSSGLELISKEEITPEIITALDMITKEKESAIKAKVPRGFRHIFSEFAGVKNSAIYNAFKDGTLIYCHYKLKKAGK